jgi:hypothetical protein
VYRSHNLTTGHPRTRTATATARCRTSRRNSLASVRAAAVSHCPWRCLKNWRRYGESVGDIMNYLSIYIYIYIIYIYISWNMFVIVYIYTLYIIWYGYMGWYMIWKSIKLEGKRWNSIVDAELLALESVEASMNMHIWMSTRLWPSQEIYKKVCVSRPKFVYD